MENNHPIAIGLRMLFLAFQKNPTQENDMFHVYFHHFRNCKPDLFSKSCNSLIEKKRFFPKVAEIVETLNEIDRQDAPILGRQKSQRIKLNCCGAIFERELMQRQINHHGKDILVWEMNPQNRISYEAHALFCLESRKGKMK